MGELKKVIAAVAMIASIGAAYAASQEDSEQQKFVTEIDKEIRQEGNREIKELKNQAANSSKSIKNNKDSFETHSDSQGIPKIADGTNLSSRSQDAMEKAESALKVANEAGNAGVITKNRNEVTTGSTCIETATRTVNCGYQGCGTGTGRSSYSYTESYCAESRDYKHVDVYEDVYVESQNNNTYKVGSNFVRDYCAYGDCP